MTDRAVFDRLVFPRLSAIAETGWSRNRDFSRFKALVGLMPNLYGRYEGFEKGFGRMGDLLVRLYDLPEVASEAKVKAAGVTIRRALPPERHVITDWIAQHFNRAWVSEVETAMSQHPVTCWVAVRDNDLLGFACHDATAKGFFGPTGVDEAARGQGIGEGLLMATLRGMREAGYGYAVIGAPGPVEFYQRRLDALEIPNSKPGISQGMLRSPKSV